MKIGETFIVRELQRLSRVFSVSENKLQSCNVLRPPTVDLKLPVRDILLSLDDFAVAYLELEQDILFHRIPEEMRVSLVEHAMEKGQETAKQIQKEFSSKDVSLILEKLNIQVQCDPAVRSVGGYPIYSECMPKKRIIILYEGSIQWKARLIQIYGLVGVLQNEDVRAACLAHELCHCILETRGDLPRVTHEVRGFKVGHFRTRSRIYIWSLDEIAADVFAKTLLDLRISPKLLDYLLTENPSQYLHKMASLSEARSRLREDSLRTRLK